jgi:hypothetical protein
MKKIILSLILISSSAILFAQTVDEVIEKHVAAMGGKEKLASIQSLHMEGVAVMQNGNEMTTSIWKVHNKLSRTERNFGMGSVIILVTDKGAWSTNPRSGGTFEAMPEDRVKMMSTEMDCQGTLFNYAAKGHKAELIGKETVEGKETFKIKLTMSNGREVNYFLDAATYYISQISMKGGMGGGRGGPGGGGAGGGGGQQRDPNAETIIKFSRYEKTPDGYVFAFATALAGMGGEMIYETIEVNPKVDDKLYKPE